MDKLDAAACSLTGPDAACTGLAEALLREVAGLLQRLAREPDFAQIIDLRSMPLAHADRECLHQRLGKGEVHADFVINGPTQIRETSYAGVWWARHADDQDSVIFEQIIVARVPEYLMAHRLDIHDAARRLAAEIDAAVRPGTRHA